MIMRKIGFIAFTWLLILPGDLACAQVYGVGTHRGPIEIIRVDERRWVVPAPQNPYGVVQFRSRVGFGSAWVRYWTIHLGSCSFTVPVRLLAQTLIVLTTAMAGV